MSETKKVNVPLLLLCGVFLVAVIVAITMAAQRNSLSAEVTELQQQIAEEQATWQAIAAEKEELQATLTETENALKEAQLSLEEATARKAELETEVEELTASNEAATQEIAGLTTQKETAQAELTTANQSITDLTDAKTALEEQIASLTAEKEAAESQLAELNTQQEALSSQVDTLTAEKEDLSSQVENLSAEGHAYGTGDRAVCQRGRRTGADPGKSGAPNFQRCIDRRGRLFAGHRGDPGGRSGNPARRTAGSHRGNGSLGQGLYRWRGYRARDHGPGRYRHADGGNAQ